MENPIYVALSRSTSLRKALETTANNIANVSTNGYRGEKMLFAEYLARTGTPGNREHISFTQDLATARDMREGPLTQTGNPLDVAIRGDAFFVVGHPAQDLYTRNGQFHMDTQGRLTTSEGYPVLSENGQPITIPQGAGGQISIDQQGIVSLVDQNGPQELGRLQLVRFADEQALRKAGGAMFSTDQEALPATEVQIVQGSIEGSNVQAIAEITQMIEIQRDYDSIQRMVDAENDRIKNAMNRIVRQA